jgi:hypothetical protein
MKLRHAATLALVGWYLMIPPPVAWGVHSISASSAKRTSCESEGSARHRRRHLSNPSGICPFCIRASIAASADALPHCKVASNAERGSWLPRGSSVLSLCIKFWASVLIAGATMSSA